MLQMEASTFSASPSTQRCHITLLITHLRTPPLPSSLGRLAQQAATRLWPRATVRIVEESVDAALAAAHDIEVRNDTDVLIASGATAAFLRKNLRLPVVILEPGVLDIARAALQARPLDDKVALLQYLDIHGGLDEIAAIFNIRIAQAAYTNLAEARYQVEQCRRDGFKVVIGSSATIQIAQDLGLTGILALTEDSCLRAFDDALAIGAQARAEAARRQRLTSVLTHLTDGVIAFDALGAVQIVNPAMEQLLGPEAQAFSAETMLRLFPALDLAAVMKSGRGSEPGDSSVVQVGKRALIASLIPTLDGGVADGALLICQDASSIQRAERRIRSARRKGQFTARYRLGTIAGSSEGMQRMLELARQYAQTDATLLITGESGTGKEVVAQGVHNAGPRRRAAFVAVNCAAFPETLLESELFGHEEGAFTGARKGGKAGLFELAHGGTIFLDEIGDMPVSLQTRLLRVLQEREVVRLGSDEPTPIDVRVIAATNRDLRGEMGAGRFRADLFYRLNVLRLHLPPLRERTADISELARLFFDAQRRPGMSDASVAALNDMARSLTPRLQTYSWPGNIRELENIVERAAVAAQAGDLRGAQDPQHLRALFPELFGPPDDVAKGRAMQASSQFDAQITSEPREPLATLDSVQKNAEAEHIQSVLRACGGRVEDAARKLGISRTTLWRRLSTMR